MTVGGSSRRPLRVKFVSGLSGLSEWPNAVVVTIYALNVCHPSRCTCAIDDGLTGSCTLAVGMDWRHAKFRYQQLDVRGRVRRRIAELRHIPCAQRLRVVGTRRTRVRLLGPGRYHRGVLGLHACSLIPLSLLRRCALLLHALLLHRTTNLAAVMAVTFGPTDSFSGLTTADANTALGCLCQFDLRPSPSPSHTRKPSTSHHPSRSRSHSVGTAISMSSTPSSTPSPTASATPTPTPTPTSLTSHPHSSPHRTDTGSRTGENGAGDDTTVIDSGPGSGTTPTGTGSESATGVSAGSDWSGDAASGSPASAPHTSWMLALWVGMAGVVVFAAAVAITAILVRRWRVRVLRRGNRSTAHRATATGSPVRRLTSTLDSGKPPMGGVDFASGFVVVDGPLDVSRSLTRSSSSRRHVASSDKGSPGPAPSHPSGLVNNGTAPTRKSGIAKRKVAFKSTRANRLPPTRRPSQSVRDARDAIMNTEHGAGTGSHLGRGESPTI